MAQAVVAAVAAISAAIADGRAGCLLDRRSRETCAGTEIRFGSSRGRSLQAGHLVLVAAAAGRLFLRRWRVLRGRERAARAADCAGAPLGPVLPGRALSRIFFNSLRSSCGDFEVRDPVFVRNVVGLRPLGQLLLVRRKLQVGEFLLLHQVFAG